MDASILHSKYKGHAPARNNSKNNEKRPCLIKADLKTSSVVVYAIPHDAPPDNNDDEEVRRRTQEVLRNVEAASPFFQANPPSKLAVFSADELQLGSLLGKGEFGMVLEVSRICGASTSEVDEPSSLGRNSILSHKEKDATHETATAILAARTSGENVLLNSTTQNTEGGSPEHSSLGTIPSSLHGSRKITRARSDRAGTNARFAVKALRTDLPADQAFAVLVDIAVEAKFLSSIYHPNIVRIHGTVGIPGKKGFMILMDKLGKTVSQQIDSWRDELVGNRGRCGRGGLAWRQVFGLYPDNLILRLKAAFDVSRALSYLHENNIVFRDLKPDNLAFDHKGTVKLFDFGLAKELKENERMESSDVYMCTGCTGTRRWMAPEVVLNQPYSTKADVFSFALLFWSLLAFQMPFQTLDVQQHTQQVIKKHKRPILPYAWPKYIRHVLKQCWDGEQCNRPPISWVREQLFIMTKQLQQKEATRDSLTNRSVYLRRLSHASILNALSDMNISSEMEASEKEQSSVASDKLDVDISLVTLSLDAKKGR